MFVWNEKKRRWFLAAAEYSRFYQGLAAALEPYLQENDRIIDMGCGLGLLSQVLYRKERMIIGYDRDAAVIRLAKEVGEGPQFVCQTLEQTAASGIACETLIACQFGSGENDYDQLFKISAARYILIKNRHKSHCRIGAHRDTCRELMSYLKERGRSFHNFDLELRFDQPLAAAEIDDFCLEYGIDRSSIRLFGRDPVLVEKPKQMTVFIVAGEKSKGEKHEDI
ncbi:MAG: hypothetical protein SPL15_03950 [Lachnospiraceae bacterium]|nr:hypothetical protein [Lachnospiraceae bacterium]